MAERTSPLTTGSVPRFERTQLVDLVTAAIACLRSTDPILAPLPAEEPARIERAVAVLAANLASGRFQAALPFLAAASAVDCALAAYARQVLLELCGEGSRIDCLKAGDSAAWEIVLQRLERLACHQLCRVGTTAWAQAEARDVASHTCSELWSWLQLHDYPFDVPFDRWAARALIFRLYGRARKERTRLRYVPESLDRQLPGANSLTYQDVIPDTSFEEWRERAANREALTQALSRLGPILAKVIRLWYLEEWSAEEIAVCLGQHIAYVYVLRFRALKKLRDVAADQRLGLLADPPVLKEEHARLTYESAGDANPCLEGATQ